MPAATDHHIGQRVKVGAIGLAAVVLLIVVAGAILGSAARQHPVVAAGGAKPDTVANMALGNDSAPEPLAAMGVTPAASANAAAAR